MCVCVCVCVRARARARACDMLFMGMAAGVMYMLCSDCFRNVCAYFLSKLVCACIHESDAELTKNCIYFA